MIASLPRRGKGAALALAMMWALLAAPGALAQTGSASGVWRGSYTCSQGLTGMSLHLREDAGGRVTGFKHFYPLPANPDTAEGCYRVRGQRDRATGQLRLSAGAWITQPPNYRTTELDGTLQAGRYTGRVIPQSLPSGCTTFDLARLPSPPALPRVCRAQGPTS